MIARVGERGGHADEAQQSRPLGALAAGSVRA